MKTKLVGSLLILSATLGLGATCESLIQQGRDFLSASNVAMAHQSFSAAVGQCPNNGEANTLYAMTLLANWPSQPGPSNFLNRLGVPAEGRDIYNWNAFIPEDTNGMPLASTGVNANEAAMLVRNDLLPVIQEARQRLALVTDTNFQMLVPGTSTPYSPGVTMDYGDVVMLQSMLYAAEFFAYTVHSWNLDVQLTALRGLALEGLLSLESVLAENPQLLTFATTNDFHASQTAFTNATAMYMKASEFIRARPSSDTRLVSYDPDQAADEEKFRLTLADLTESLTHPVVLCTDTNYTVSLNNYFAAKHPLRSLLPRFYDNYVVVGTLPDTTFGGIIEGVSEVGLEYALSKSIPMRSLMQGLMQEPEHFMCSFSTLTGRVYSLEMSTDLVHWTQVSEFLSEGGTYGFMDGGSGAAQKRFYRLVDLEASYITIDGQVIDVCSGLPIVGATVVIGMSSRTAITDAQGRFHFQTRALSGTPMRLTLYAWADGYNGDGQSITVSSSVKGLFFKLAPSNPTPPPNDNFQNRQPVTGTEVTVSGQSCGATIEPEEYSDVPYGYSSVWYTWTPSISARVRMNVVFLSRYIGWRSGISVYTGDELSTLAWIAGGPGRIAGSDIYHELSLEVTAGVTYHICVTTDSPGEFTLLISTPPAIEMVSPIEAQTFHFGRDPIFVNINAADPDGSIKDVKVYSHSTYSYHDYKLLNTLTQFPSTFVWTNAALGDWTFIAVATDNAGNTSSVERNIYVRPINDDFADRISLLGSNVLVTGSTLGASREYDEPIHGPYNERHSVWWAWTAPVEMDVTVTAYAHYSDNGSCTAMGVYTGSPLSWLSEVGLSEVPWNTVSNFSRVSFHASANTQYQIAVAGDFGGEFFLTIVPGLPPTLQVQSLNGQHFTTEGPIPLSASATDPEGRLTRVDFYLGRQMVGSDFQSPYSIIVSNVPSGFYEVFAAATDEWGCTTFNYGGFITIAPRNDDFTNRIVLVGSHIRTNFSNAGASAEMREPMYDGDWPYYSVWWSWTAPSDGHVTIRVESWTYGTALAVFTGITLPTLAKLDSDIDWEGAPAVQLSFPVTEGTAYQIMVDSRDGSTVQGQLQIDFSPSP